MNRCRPLLEGREVRIGCQGISLYTYKLKIDIMSHILCFSAYYPGIIMPRRKGGKIRGSDIEVTKWDSIYGQLTKKIPFESANFT